MHRIVLYMIIPVLSILLFSCSDSRKTYWENGKLQSELSYKNDKLNGRAVWYFENGLMEQEAYYLDNVLNGSMKRWYSNGRLETESVYINGKLEGPAKTFDGRGNLIIEENYLHDSIHGTYRELYPDGLPKIEGQYVKGLFTGRWIYYDPFGQVVGIGNYSAGTGKQKAWWPNGNLKREIPYRRNLKHGEERWYDRDGNLEKVVVYKDGKAEPST